MLEKINIEMFTNEIEANEWNVIKDKIDSQFEKLTNEIKNLYDKKDTYYFSELDSDISYFYAPSNFPTSISKLKTLIKIYNDNLKRLENYNEISKELYKTGYEKNYNQLIQKITKLFKEMLDYKHKKYDNSISFLDLLEKTSNYYNYYKDDFYILKKIYTKGSIPVIDDYSYPERYVYPNEVEKIILLNEIYNNITSPNDDYKKYADFYIDIDLQPGKTYKTIYDAKMSKFVTLLHKMLDYVKVPHDNDEDYYLFLTPLVVKYYPFYSDSLFHLQSTLSNPSNNYIDCIDTIEKTYNYLSHYHENYQEKLEEYKLHESDEDNWDFGDEEDE